MHPSAMSAADEGWSRKAQCDFTMVRMPIVGHDLFGECSCVSSAGTCRLISMNLTDTKNTTEV